MPVAEHPYYMYAPAPGARMLEYVSLAEKPERRQDLLPSTTSIRWSSSPGAAICWRRRMPARW